MAPPFKSFKVHISQTNNTKLKWMKSDNNHADTPYNGCIENLLIFQLKSQKNI